MANVIIGVDLGGTQMRVARFDEQLNILERQAKPTLAEQGPDSLVTRLLDLIAEVVPDDHEYSGRDRRIGAGTDQSARGNYRAPAESARL